MITISSARGGSGSLPLASLPTPAERPNADVVIFDGNCPFCRAQVQRLHRWGGGRLAFRSLHDPEVARLYPDLTHEQLMREMYVVDRRGRRHAGAASLRYLSRRLPRLWIVAPLLHFPFSLPIWRWLYQQVAKRRYQLFAERGGCEGGVCSVPGREPAGGDESGE